MSVVAGIAEFVRQETGIVLPAARETAILAAVARAAPGLDPGMFVRAASARDGGRRLVDRLIDEVTVQETTFLRDRDQLDAIDWHRLLQAAGAAGPGAVRVWSAGCASGEEPYTLALLAAEALAPSRPAARAPSLEPARLPVDVLGTDISGAALAAAAAGRYRERAVRALDPSLRGRYLDRQPDASYIVGDRLRRQVRFRRHNLARDPKPPGGETGFDLIVCRNVLIYLEPPLAERVIVSLERALRPGGRLLLGAADALIRAASRSAPPHAARGALRRPLGRDPSLSREHQFRAVLDAVDAGDRDGALAGVASLLTGDPLDADAHFMDGLVTLEAGRPARAVAALRRALYADAQFGLAAFTLGRAYDALGDIPAARRAYEQALRTLDPADDRRARMLQQVDIADIAAACRARLAADG
jgi:chemotaxis protein methyltransferase CheR